MATSSTSATGSSSAASAVTTSSIDVASIVSQLMTVENKPIDALKTKITSVQTVISDLGTMKSKVATLQSALNTFEDPATYNNPTASSSDSSVVTATASSNAAIGSVTVSVSKLASASQIIVNQSRIKTGSGSIQVPAGLNIGQSGLLAGGGSNGTLTGVTLTSGSGATATGDLTYDSSGNVTAISITNGGTGFSVNDHLTIGSKNLGAAAPTALTIGTVVTGSNATPGTASIAFTGFTAAAGDSISVAGLTFTPTVGAVTADQIANAFATGTSTVGTITGSLTAGYTVSKTTSGAITLSTASTGATATAPDSTLVSIAGSAAAQASATYTKIADGADATYSQDAITFQNLKAGDSVTIAGGTFVAGVGGATAAQVASAFNSGSVGNYTGGSITTAVSGYTASNLSGSTLKFTSTTSGANELNTTTAYETRANSASLSGVVVTNLSDTFASANDPIALDAASGLSITVSGKTYNTKDPGYPLVATGSTGPTLNDLAAWINGLGDNVQANIIQTTSTNDFVLQISGTQTGKDNAVDLNLGTSSISKNAIQVADDAVATINGVTVNRSSNAISDVVNGMTFNLVGLSQNGNSTSVTVQQGADNSSAMINTLIKAYNDVVNQYNTYTANSNSGTTNTTNGDFANDPAILSFVNNIKSMFAYGATDTTSAVINGFGLASDATNFDAKNGYLKINNVQYNFSSIGQSNPTVSQFVSWVNGLNAGVTASFNGSGIQLINSQTGGTNTIDFSGVSNQVTRATVSLATMGMDIQLDGTIQFNTTSYQKAATNGLYAKLAKGLKMGFAGNGSSLDNFITSEIDPSKGALVQQISTQQASITTLQKKQADLQDHLNQVQNNYITQYSALNALLFQLNSTSTSLASALAAVTNINAGK